MSSVDVEFSCSNSEACSTPYFHIDTYDTDYLHVSGRLHNDSSDDGTYTSEGLLYTDAEGSEGYSSEDSTYTYFFEDSTDTSNSEDISHTNNSSNSSHSNFSAGSTLKCLYTNAQSIVNKHYELQAVIDLYDPDVIGISETWLNSKISDKEYCIDGFHKPIRQDRTDTKDGRGGGVFLLIKKTINFVQIFPHNSIEFTNSVWVEIGRAHV